MREGYTRGIMDDLDKQTLDVLGTSTNTSGLSPQSLFQSSTEAHRPTSPVPF